MYRDVVYRDVLSSGCDTGPRAYASQLQSGLDPGCLALGGKMSKADGGCATKVACVVGRIQERFWITDQLESRFGPLQSSLRGRPM